MLVHAKAPSSGDHSTNISGVLGVIFTIVKWPEREPDHSSRAHV
jgi:hypothetical protein